MAKVVINVDIEVDPEIADSVQARAILHSVKDSQGNDITTEFREYCDENSLPLDTEDQVVIATSNFANAKRDSLPWRGRKTCIAETGGNGLYHRTRRWNIGPEKRSQAEYPV